MNANVKDKVKQALYGITISDEWPDISGVSSTSERYYKPPSYMIKMALEILYGGRLPSGYDKSAWQIPILFHNNNWRISDWKNFAWSINTRTGTKKEAEILFRKFELTSKILDKYVRSQAKEHFENENISLDNRFEKSLRILKHFIQKLRKSIQDSKSNEYQSLEVGETRSKALKRIWEATQEVEIYTITTSIFFFSHTEVIFDACFSLTDRKGLKFKEFRALEWSDKFKFFIAPSSNPEIDSLFSELLEIKALRVLVWVKFQYSSFSTPRNTRVSEEKQGLKYLSRLSCIPVISKMAIQENLQCPKRAIFTACTLALK